MTGSGEREIEPAAEAATSGSPIAAPSVILASRSPRRLELLSLLVPRDRIRVVPPPSPEEAGFEGLSTRGEIEARLRSIVVAKCEAVLRHLGSEAGGATVVAADTVIVARSEGGRDIVLGQPPEEDWRETTRRWFTEFYAGRTHSVLTGLCVAGPGGRSEAIAETFVTFRTHLADDLKWYLNTGEPQGKAGGYAIQGAGSVFVERVEGSLTNVVGLPLETLRRVLPPVGG